MIAALYYNKKKKTIAHNTGFRFGPLHYALITNGYMRIARISGRDVSINIDSNESGLAHLTMRAKNKMMWKYIKKQQRNAGPLQWPTKA